MWCWCRMTTMTIWGRLRFGELAGLESMREVRWVTSLGVGETLAAVRGVRLSRSRSWIGRRVWRWAGLEITAVPSRHFSGRSMFNRFETLWSAFVLKGSKHRFTLVRTRGGGRGLRRSARRMGRLI